MGGGNPAVFHIITTISISFGLTYDYTPLPSYPLLSSSEEGLEILELPGQSLLHLRGRSGHLHIQLRHRDREPTCVLFLVIDMPEVDILRVLKVMLAKESGELGIQRRANWRELM